MLDNLYNLVNYRYNDYLIVINFAEKNKNENELIQLIDLMKKFDNKKILVLRDLFLKKMILIFQKSFMIIFILMSMVTKLLLI